MILTVEEVKAQIACDGLTDSVIVARLKSIEEVIRAYTNNNFQMRKARFSAGSDEGNILCGASPFIQTGDTVEISQSGVNDGLYTVLNVTENKTEIDGNIFPVSFNLVTKIQYPADVKQCAVDLFQWKKDFGAKIGIKSESETLSRHSESVTYEDSATLFMGYPVGILSGLALHKKARC